MKNNKLSFLAFLFVFFLIIPAGAQQSTVTEHNVTGISVDRLERYDAFLQKEVDEGRIPGAVSLVMRYGRVAHSSVYGYSSLKDKMSMEEDQIFFIQSMTKPIVTTAFMMLFEEGHFLLNDPVSKYFPWFKGFRVSKDFSAGSAAETEPADKPITIAHLLSHTAGFSHGLGNNKLEQEILRKLYFEKHKDIEGRVRALISMPLIGHPGEQWSYSASPDVLSLLIEHFSGMSTADFLEERIFAPLGMTDTGYNVPKSKQDRMVKLHGLNEQGKLVNSPRQTPMDGNTVFGGSNGLFSTAGDYAKFGQLFLNKGMFNGQRLLSRKTVELMTINHVENLYPQAGNGFGLGFGILTDPALGKTVASKGQYYWGGAYCTYFFIDPQEQLVALLMTQVAPFSGYYGSKMAQFIYSAIDD